MTFWTKFIQKCISSQKRKSEHHHSILHIRISLGTKFQFKLIIFIFWTIFAQNRVFPVQYEKREHRHWILHIRISLSIKFHLKLTILIFLDQISTKRVFPVEYEKSEQHHWILHIRIRLGAIFLGAMALLGQSRERWPSMAPLGYVEKSKRKMLWHF